jgi:WD40 repeat protein
MPIVVTGDGDGTVRVWDLIARQQTGSSMTGHEDAAPAVAVARSDTHGSDERVQPVADSIARLAASRDEPGISSLAITEAPSGWIGVLCTDDGGVLAVDLATGTLRYKIPGDSGRAVTAVTCEVIVGRSVAILADNHGERRAIDLLSGGVIDVGHIDDRLLTDRRRPTSALIVVDGKLVEVRCRRGSITVGDGDSAAHLGYHDVTAVACAYLNDRPVAFTGGKDGIVQVWDLLGRRRLDSIAVHGPVFAIGATNDGDLVIGAGGEVLAFRHAGVNIQPPGDGA